MTEQLLVEKFTNQVAWIRENHGQINPHLSIKSVEGVRGIIALREIYESALLIHIPWALIIGSDFINQSIDGCDIVQKLEIELRLGEKSFWHPYLDISFSQEERLPMQWDQDILDELQGLPPYDCTKHIAWYDACCGVETSFDDADNLTQQALINYVTRSSDRGMIPFYDLLNHDNERLNTEVTVSPKGIQVWACTNIGRDDEIYNSYGVEATSNIFRDYGFVEAWPQIWSWSDKQKSVHTFILLSEITFIIEPTKEIINKLRDGSRSSLEFIRASACNHNLQLPIEKKHRFLNAAQILLYKLPTTYNEDEELYQKLRNTSKEPQSIEENIRLQDLILCIKYRKAFKKAIRFASTFP